MGKWQFLSGLVFILLIIAIFDLIRPGTAHITLSYGMRILDILLLEIQLIFTYLIHVFIIILDKFGMIIITGLFIWILWKHLVKK